MLGASNGENVALEADHRAGPVPMESEVGRGIDTRECITARSSVEGTVESTEVEEGGYQGNKPHSNLHGQLSGSAE